MGNEAKSNIKMSPTEIQQLKDSSEGTPLPASLRHSLEIEFKSDLSGVQIHTTLEAVRATTLLGLNAFTHGKDIYFNAGKYQPDTAEGRRLLAHEVTHIVQQR